MKYASILFIILYGLHFHSTQQIQMPLSKRGQFIDLRNIYLPLRHSFQFPSSSVQRNGLYYINSVKPPQSNKPPPKKPKEKNLPKSLEDDEQAKKARIYSHLASRTNGHFLRDFPHMRY